MRIGIQHVLAAAILIGGAGAVFAKATHAGAVVKKRMTICLARRRPPLTREVCRKERAAASRGVKGTTCPKTRRRHYCCWARIRLAIPRREYEKLSQLLSRREFVLGSQKSKPRNKLRETLTQPWPPDGRGFGV